MAEENQNLISVLQYLKANHMQDAIFAVDRIITEHQLSDDEKELEINAIITGVIK